MSTRYIAIIVMILSQVLPMIGINIGSEDLTNTATTLVAIASGLYVIYRGWQKGDHTIVGSTK